MAHFAIVFDLDENWIGGSYYIRNLVSALGTLPPDEQPEITLISSHGRSYRFIQETGYTRLNWITRTQFGERPDAFPFDAIFPWPIADQDDRTVSWIPDFQEHHLPDFFSAEEMGSRRHHHRLRFGTAGLIVSSNDVRKDVDLFYPGECPRVEVVHFATFNQFNFDRFPQVAKKYGVSGKYVMCPNQVWVHKNHVVVVKALEILASKGARVPVYFTGNEGDYRVAGYADTLKRMLADRGLADCAKFLGFIPREDQLILMKGAEYIIQPSLFEGWSTVIEDAKAMQQFVVASNLAVHEEQLDRNFKLFAPKNANELADIMLEFHRNPPTKVGADYSEAQVRFGRDFVGAMIKFTEGKVHPRQSSYITNVDLRKLSRNNIESAAEPELGGDECTSDTLQQRNRVTDKEGISPPSADMTKLKHEKMRLARACFDADWYRAHYSLGKVSSASAFRQFVRRGIRKNHSPNQLFDSIYYVEVYPDVPLEGGAAVDHFLKHGLSEGRNPNVLFDTDYYLENNRDVADSGIPAFVHFFQHGLAEGRSPHPLFDPDFYLNRYPDVVASGMPAYLHFLLHGVKEGRDPHALFDTAFYVEQYPASMNEGRGPFVYFLKYGLYAGHRTHLLFDPDLYNAQYADVAASGQAPLMHFARYGKGELRNPHPFFDVKFYLSSYQDLSTDTLTVLDHFMQHGAKEKRRPHPLFDAEFYARRYPEVDDSGMAPFLHFLRKGLADGYAPNRYFDGDYYARRYGDVGRSELTASVHYALFGLKAHRAPSALFDPAHYATLYPDVYSAGMSAMSHYLLYGIKEGRRAVPRQIPLTIAAMSDPLEYYMGEKVSLTSV
ncbi:glycosyltransferase [Ensifer adhaerens]|uniref:glycosyltransferase n=1 Tax=Ensifer adhaerens TaxID=106592 RepID=UPI000DC3F042|nr:glycosyltransferase [Ensifer adhaerens]RAS07148.1 glycosyl transferase family 1 [Ensifer adhaerens]